MKRARTRRNVEIIWASTSEVYNVVEDRMVCHIITTPDRCVYEGARASTARVPHAHAITRLDVRQRIGLLNPPGNQLSGLRMARNECARNWLGQNLPLATFLGFYFLTIVFANLLYPFFGLNWQQAVGSFNLAEFSTARTFGYWLLLFLPFLVSPPVAIGTRALLSRPVARLAHLLPDFRPRDYVVILGLCYCYVAWAFWQADAYTLMSQADAITSTRIRFQILAGVGYWPQAILKSVLMFLSVYSFIQAFRSGGAFWRLVAVFNLVVMSVLLLLLNMKWPALLLYLAVVLCALLFLRRRVHLIAIAAVLALTVAYVAIGFFVMRIAPEGQVGRFLPGRLIVLAFDRMAVGYPYYYQTFTLEGQVCGTLLDRIQRKTNPCQPSNLIYTKIFGEDEFGGASTQPAGVNIYGYALGGWPGAFIELLIASVVIGGFMCLSFRPASTAIVQSMIVMGGLAGYYFSQLPVEAALIYDHGILWWAALVLGYALARNLLAYRWRERI